MMRLLVVSACVALAALALACGIDGDGSSPGPAPTESMSPTVDGQSPTAADATPGGEDDDSAVVDVAGGDEPLFVYSGSERLGGDEVTFADAFAAGKPVVLNFWAGLCPPCRQEMPDFQAVYSERSDEFLLLGVDVGPFTGLGNEVDARDLLDELGVTYPTARVDTDTLLREYNVFGMPATVFLAADGSIVSQKNGLISESEFRERVQEMIDASG